MSNKPTCNKCGKPIRWEKNEAGNWVPYNTRGKRIHWETCTRVPEKDTPLALKKRIEEMELELARRAGMIRRLEVQVADIKETHHVSEEFLECMTTPVVNLHNTAKALEQAFTKGVGNVELRKQRFILAVQDLREAEKRKKELALHRKQTRASS